MGDFVYPFSKHLELLKTDFAFEIWDWFVLRN